MESLNTVKPVNKSPPQTVEKLTYTIGYIRIATKHSNNILRNENVQTVFNIRLEIIFYFLGTSEGETFNWGY